MNPAIATVIAAATAAAVSLIVAGINAWVGRGGRRADFADQITESSERIMTRMDTELDRVNKKCAKCEDELEKVLRVLRGFIRAWERNDEEHLKAAISAAKELLR